ncbi:interferon gamma receptor 1 [Xyrichtys novacula]|uniref:Interferon gamma receptor 1 n=1 Tax=Xyrichtys novacula TaxID=13765 RepID=A0AAV1EWD2_XYRNO|nr:interferon gamma receptor 1 [Xyrichtys novacula]
MDLDGALGALLLLLISGASVGTLLPPTDVTVSCDNLNVTARWKYREQHPNTRFRVHILSDNGTFETTDQHFDLSPFVWKSEESYMQVYYITVTAILGRNQSEPAESNTLTFNDLRLSHLKCMLAFPPVEVKKDGSDGAMVTFRNPFHYYKDLQRATKSKSAYFKFTVTTANDKSFESNCLVDQENCTEKISFTEGEDQCVTLRGKLYDGKDFRYMVVNETGPICVDTSADLYVVFFALLLVVFVAGIVITVAVCLTKSWTMKREKPTLPKALEPSMGSRKLYFPEQKEDCCNVTLITEDTCRSPSVTSEEDDLQDRRERRDTGDTTGRSEACDNCGYGEGGLLETSGTDNDSVNDSVKTESFTMDSEEEREEKKEKKEEEQEKGDCFFEGEDKEEDVEEKISPYDCPHNLSFDKR